MDSDQLLMQLLLTPQEQQIYWHHLANLYGPGKSVSPTGDVSTVLQSVVSGPGGQFYNIPTVWDGQVLTVPEAMQRAAAVGWHNFPSYPTPLGADLRYESMHQGMDKDTGRYLDTHKSSLDVLNQIPAAQPSQSQQPSPQLQQTPSQTEPTK